MSTTVTDQRLIHVLIYCYRNYNASLTCCFWLHVHVCIKILSCLQIEFLFPITIIPVDDSAPVLQVNTGLKIFEGMTYKITALLLKYVL